MSYCQLVRPTVSLSSFYSNVRGISATLTIRLELSDRYLSRFTQCVAYIQFIRHDVIVVANDDQSVQSLQPDGYTASGSAADGNLCHLSAAVDGRAPHGCRRRPIVHCCPQWRVRQPVNASNAGGDGLRGPGNNVNVDNHRCPRPSCIGGQRTRPYFSGEQAPQLCTDNSCCPHHLLSSFMTANITAKFWHGQWSPSTLARGDVGLWDIAIVQISGYISKTIQDTPIVTVEY